MLPEAAEGSTKGVEQKNIHTMKTLLRFLLIGLLSAGTLFAQTTSYYETRKTTPSGYWDVFANLQEHQTSIRYYGADQQLLHQEVLPNQLVKLTRKNVHRLNAALVKICQNELVSSNVRGVAMPATLEHPRLIREQKRMMDLQRRASSMDVAARVIPSNDGGAGFKVHVYNPHQERLRIDVLKANGQLVAQHFDQSVQRYLRFNMESMASGEYKVCISKVREKKPVVENLISLGRQPSRSFITIKTETPKDTNALVSAKP